MMVMKKNATKFTMIVIVNASMKATNARNTTVLAKITKVIPKSLPKSQVKMIAKKPPSLPKSLLRIFSSRSRSKSRPQAQAQARKTLNLLMDMGPKMRLLARETRPCLIPEMGGLSIITTKKMFSTLSNHNVMEKRTRCDTSRIH